jgi:hypothetical protein
MQGWKFLEADVGRKMERVARPNILDQRPDRVLAGAITNNKD